MRRHAVGDLVVGRMSGTIYQVLEADRHEYLCRVVVAKGRLAKGDPNRIKHDQLLKYDDELS